MGKLVPIPEEKETLESWKKPKKFKRKKKEEEEKKKKAEGKKKNE
jgi:hypothetical protein